MPSSFPDSLRVIKVLSTAFWSNKESLELASQENVDQSSLAPGSFVRETAPSTACGYPLETHDPYTV